MEKPIIPIFYACDDAFIKYTVVSLHSMIRNASRDYQYRVYVLHTEASDAMKKAVMDLADDCFDISFVDVNEYLDSIADKLPVRDYYSKTTYYRLFIADMFPEYEKVLYIDSDTVVRHDISELYNTELDNNILGACPEEYVQNTPEFRIYAEKALGVDPTSYINAGVLLINLDQFRKDDIEKKFIDLITEYDFDLLDPDQAYLNYLCRDKICVLPNGWNKEPLPEACEGKKNIVHYALYKKPWQCDDVIDGDCFWNYAKKSPFYEVILQRKNSFTAEDAAENEKMAKEILEHAIQIADSDYTFAKKLGRN